MTKHKIIAPDGNELHIGTARGVRIFKHGDIVTNEKLASYFPNNFILIEDETKTQPEKQQEPNPPQKRKGRPVGSGKKTFK